MVGGCGTCRGHRIPPPPTQAGGFVPDCPLRRRLPGCLPVSTLHIGPNCGPETLPQVPALADAIHHTPPLAGGPPGHRAGRRPGASSMHPRRRWPPWATVPVGSPGQQHDPAPPVAALNTELGGWASNMIRPHRWPPWAPCRSTARGQQHAPAPPVAALGNRAGRQPGPAA
ncbi:hypothetical protein D3C78_248780 [compost metagenome]